MVLTIRTPEPVMVAHQAHMFGVDSEIIEVDGDVAFMELSGVVEKTFRAILGTHSQVIDTSRRVIRANSPQGNWTRYTFK